MLDFTGPALPLPAESTVVTTPRKGERRRGARLGFGQQLVLLSWNLLAPPYKRMGGGVREAELSDTWHARVLSQIEYVRSVEPDIVSLQEFWCAEPGFVAMWASFCEEEGYHMLTTQRTSGKADGLCVLVREHIELELGVGVHASFSFNDWGDRIVQVVRIPVDDEFLAVINTHLTFPHANNHDGPMRRCQALKLAQLTEGLSHVVCAGDMNGNLDDEAVRVLQTGGLRPMTSRAEGWLSHVAHNGALMACDFVLTRGRCCVSKWELGYTRQALLEGSLSSDHRPVLSTIILEASAMDSTSKDSDTLDAPDVDGL